MLALAIASVGSQALAQSDDDKRAGARAAATEGVHAMDEGRWADATALFARAEALLHAPTHLLYYARASVKLGKLVQANEAYLKILRETLPPKAPKAFVEAQASAAAEQPKVEQSIPHLTILVEGQGAKGAHVTMNGTEVPQPLLGIPAPFDPGDLELEAVAPGWRSEKVKVSLKEGASETVKLPLSIADATAAPPVVETPKVVVATGKPGLRAAGWISVGVGVVALAAGTYFVVDNNNKRADADALCTGPGGVCPASQRSAIQSLDSDANTSAVLSWIGYGVGGVGVGMGVVMLILSRGGHAETPPQPTASVRPWFGPGSVGLSGTF